MYFPERIVTELGTSSQAPAEMQHLSCLSISGVLRGFHSSGQGYSRRVLPIQKLEHKVVTPSYQVLSWLAGATHHPSSDERHNVTKLKRS